MFKRSILSMVSLFVCLVFLFSSVGSVFAASNEQQTKVTKQEINNKRIKDAVDKLSKHVKRTKDGTFELNVPESLKNEIDSETLGKITQGMEGINSLIRAGKLVSTDDLKVYDPKDKSLTIQGNVNQFVYTWYGYDLYLDSTNANILAGDLGMAAGAGTIAAAITAVVNIPAGVLTGIAAGLAGFGSGAITRANASGNGVIISFLFTMNGSQAQYVPFWVSSQ